MVVCYHAPTWGTTGHLEAGREGFPAFRSGSLHDQRRPFSLGTLRRRGEVEVQPLLLGAADEVPVRGEPLAAAVAEVVEDDATHRTDAGGRLEEFDKVLGGEAAGERF
jgi:hypothetical protein